MVKKLIPAISLIALLGSCASLKPLNFTSSKPVASSAQTGNSEAKFIDQITVTAQTTGATKEKKADHQQTTITRGPSVEERSIKDEPKLVADGFARSTETESLSSLQQKYAVLLNIDASQLQNKLLLGAIDEWYGTRYHMGGTTKSGVDCSAFVGAVYATVFAVSLPRTARDQYRHCRHISRTELQEGDLLFFNTRGYVSHVGIYLRNNKFIHASTSKGVVVSDMFEPYYLKRFVGAGRIDDKQEPMAVLH